MGRSISGPPPVLCGAVGCIRWSVGTSGAPTTSADDVEAPPGVFAREAVVKQAASRLRWVNYSLESGFVF